MTLGDRFQSLLLSAGKPEKKNAALATRMLKKYTTSLAAMKELSAIPETRDLQESYIEYFTTARQLFSDYLEAQEKVPFTNEGMVSAKKKLEELDKANKQRDKELRDMYRIKKH